MQVCKHLRLKIKLNVIAEIIRKHIIIIII